MNIPLKKWHRFSGIIIAAFFLLHVTNHLFALGGPSLHITVMKLLRHVYRFWPVEILLLSCVLFQIVSGITLVIKKGFLKQPMYVIIQVFSGLYLSFFLIYHVRAVMLGRYRWNVNTDFYFAADVANRYPEKLFFIPYYTLSLVCAFAHIACAHYIKRMEHVAALPETGDTKKLSLKYRKETIAISITGALITLLIMLALCGALYTI